MQETKRDGFNPWVRKVPWRRAWQLTPVFLPLESHGQRGLMGYSPQAHKEKDTTEATQQAHTHFHFLVQCLWYFASCVSHLNSLRPFSMTSNHVPGSEQVSELHFRFISNLLFDLLLSMVSLSNCSFPFIPCQTQSLFFVTPH